MQELIKAGGVYVAQPPLYQVTRRKKVDYVLNDRAMRQIYADLGMDGTSLVVRDGESGEEHRRISGDELRQVVELLTKLEELVRIIQRRGIDFAKFLDVYEQHGKLPEYQFIIAAEAFFPAPPSA